MKTDSQSKLTFASKITTNIWHEQPSTKNPYLAIQCRLHGYDIVDLMQHKSFVEVLYLLFSGELPNKTQSALLEQLMIAQINPGPRHPATRAAMTAGISKTRPVHILPIGLMVLGGEHLGAAEVEQAMEFIQQHLKDNPYDLAQQLLTNATPPTEGDWHIAPGFGSRFNDIDPMPQTLANHLAQTHTTTAIQWGNQFASAIAEQQLGWLNTGIAAAVFIDLNIPPREGSGLFQLINAPGLLAHGMEQTHHPVTDMPFIKDEDYVIE